MLAITEKVVLRVEDLLTWITEAQDWSWGLSAVYDHSATVMPRPGLLADNCVMDLTEVDKEKDLLGNPHFCYKKTILRMLVLLKNVSQRYCTTNIVTLKECLLLLLNSARKKQIQ